MFLHGNVENLFRAFVAVRVMMFYGRGVCHCQIISLNLHPNTLFYSREEMDLVIVESPAKAKTIERFLGKGFTVMSSRGHIRDLAKKGVDLEPSADGGTPTFAPNYEIPAEKRDQVRELKTAARKAQTVWLASDEDREGEAIAWHLYDVLGLKPENTRRIAFHEITKEAIDHAMAHPRTIDMDRVDAQQARRVLDRIVGFELSPVLWRKIKPSLSAGRVQSVAVRLIADREREIEAFKSETYYRISGQFATEEGAMLRASLSSTPHTHDAALEILQACAKAKYSVGRLTTKEVKRSPAPPFTTSTLQQEAGRKLGFSVTQTMRIAQDLYEAGYITYMRTDSLNLAEQALRAMNAVICDKLGAQYAHTRRYHTSAKGAQEAHEAIRPTYADREKIDGDERAQRLYTLIRRRALASQMADAQLERTQVEIAVSNRPEHFSAQGEVIKFDGFLKVYMEGRDDDAADSAEAILPKLTLGETLEAVEINALERHTLPPARYTEVTLVKKMEEIGIGRPSTYAPTISTIQQREYVGRGDKEGVETPFETLTLNPLTASIMQGQRVEKTGSDRGKLVPTDTGLVVNDFLAEYFPDILDYHFTAQVEEQFDEIAEGKAPWQEKIASFYDRFHPEVDKALTTRLEHKVGERVLGKDPDTGKDVSVKIGRFGPLVQIGGSDDNEKPRFASLLKGQSMATITLDEALALFAFPRVLGDYEGSEVSVAIGRFGPYVKHNGKFASIPKGEEPAEVTLQRAIELIDEKRAAEAAKSIKKFDQEPDLEIVNGRFGPYIVYKKANYKLPKSITDPGALTLEEVMDIIAKQPVPKTKRTAKTKKK